MKVRNGAHWSRYLVRAGIMIASHREYLTSMITSFSDPECRILAKVSL